MKLKKEEVYVEITTQEEANKAKEMLLKYGEKIWEGKIPWEVTDECNKVSMQLDNKQWAVYGDDDSCTKVTLEQLEEILSSKTKSQRITALEAEVKELKERIEALEAKLEPKFEGIDIIAEPFKVEQNPQFEVGKVYKEEDTKFMFYCTESDNLTLSGFGFDAEGNWHECISTPFICFTKATPKEWLERLKQEAVRRGLKDGVKYLSPNKHFERILNPNLKWENDCLSDCKDDVVMLNGVWAEIIESKIEVGMYGAFWDDDENYGVFGKFNKIDNKKHYKFQCSNGAWYRNFQPIKKNNL